jgi:hypothetical protein
MATFSETQPLLLVRAAKSNKLRASPPAPRKRNSLETVSDRAEGEVDDRNVHIAIGAMAKLCLNRTVWPCSPF